MHHSHASCGRAHKHTKGTQSHGNSKTLLKAHGTRNPSRKIIIMRVLRHLPILYTIQSANQSTYTTQLELSASVLSRGLQRKLARGLISRGPVGRHPVSVYSSAPKDVTPFIIRLRRAQLRSATFFSYNQAFILILWWLSQALEQTVAAQLALGGRRFKRADTLLCQSMHVNLYLRRDCVNLSCGVIHVSTMTVLIMVELFWQRRQRVSRSLKINYRLCSNAESSLCQITAFQIPDYIPLYTQTYPRIPIPVVIKNSTLHNNTIYFNILMLQLRFGTKSTYSYWKMTTGVKIQDYIMTRSPTHLSKWQVHKSWSTHVIM